MYPREERMLLRTEKNRGVLHPTDTSVFSTLEGRLCQRVLQTSADIAFWKRTTGVIRCVCTCIFSPNIDKFERLRTRCISSEFSASELQQEV